MTFHIIWIALLRTLIMTFGLRTTFSVFYMAAAWWDVPINGYSLYSCNNWILFFLLISLEICKACCCAACCNGECLEVVCHTISVLENFSRASDTDVSLAIECRVPGRTLACKCHSTKDSIWVLQSSRSSWLFWGFSFPFLLLGIWPFVHVDGHKVCLVREECKSVTFTLPSPFAGSAWFS